MHGIEKTLIQRFAVGYIFDHGLFRMFQTDAIQVVHCAFKIKTFFAIELKKGTGIFQHVFVTFYFAKKLRDFGFDTAVAADIKFVAGIFRCLSSALSRRRFLS